MMRCYPAAVGFTNWRRDGERPIVITLFGGDRSEGAPLSDFARSLQERWQLGDDAPARRRDEDRAACDRLGCYLIHLPFADAVYRADENGQPLYDSEEAIFGEIREAVDHRSGGRGAASAGAEGVQCPIGDTAHRRLSTSIMSSRA